MATTPPQHAAPPARRGGPPPERTGPRVVLTGVASDSHTWNLVYLQLLLQENGAEVVNLGACVPDAEVVDACREHRPDVLVVSSVNGHGAIDGARMVRLLRTEFDSAGLPAVIGGKLGVSGAADAAGIRADLRGAGFDAVFQDTELGAFVDYVRLSAPAPVASLGTGT